MGSPSQEVGLTCQCVTIQEEKFEMSITSVSASFSAVVWGASIPTYGSSHSLSTALISKVERRTCASMQACPYTAGGMATSTSGFDLSSLVPKIPGEGLISQLSNPLNLVSLFSLMASFINLVLYYHLHSKNITQTGGINVDVRVQNVLAPEE